MPANEPPVVPLGKKLSALLFTLLQAEETILLQLPGNLDDALVCTQRRVFVLKTANFQNHSVFQLGYQNISGVQISMGMLVGYFELSSTDMQTTPKGNGVEVSKAPNCIGLSKRKHGALFEEACAFITSRAQQAQETKSDGLIASATAAMVLQSAPDAALSALSKLGELRASGVVTQEEFDAKKAELLARI